MVRAQPHLTGWSPVTALDLSVVNAVLEGSWAEAASDYAAEWRARRSQGRRGPVGAQKHLNAVIDRRFREAGWNAHSSTYMCEGLWFRVTFRHQMSLGSNFLDALKAVVRHGFDVAVIAAATRDFLESISPADAPALTSFEKLRADYSDLEGVISVPIVIAALEPSSLVTGPVLDAIRDPSRRR